MMVLATAYLLSQLLFACRGLPTEIYCSCSSIIHLIVSLLLLYSVDPYFILKLIYVTQSGKTGLIAYLKVSRNTGFKYFVCCSSPMVEAMCTKFSHVLHQFLTFQSIHCK